MTPARIDLHKVSIEPNGDLVCSCKVFTAKKHLFGGRQALRIAHAHAANPYLPLTDLLDFVGRVPE